MEKSLVKWVPDHGFQCVLKKYENHPSICTIQTNVNTVDGFDFCPITVSQAQKIIQNMDPKKTQGWDNIPTQLLHIGSHSVAQTSTGHIDCAFEKTTYPDSFKNDDNLDRMNYWPVGILTGISKTYEKAMSSQLSGYFDEIFYISCRLFVNNTAVSRLFSIWLKILNMPSIKIIMLHVPAWT